MKFLFALAAALLLSASAQAQQSFNILVNRNSNMLEQIGPDMASAIFGGQITSWDCIGDSGLTGNIEAVRLADTAAAAQAFLGWSGLTQFAPNVTVITGGQAPLFVAALAASRPLVIAVNATAPVLPNDKVLRLDY
jgi:hypothetical protein